MKFVTIDDFTILPYKLPAADTMRGGFDEYMTEMEEEILRKIMGHALYDRMIAEAFYIPTTEWSGFVDGSSYVLSGKTYKWAGLRKLLIPVLYAYRTRDTYDNHTDTGVNEAKVENATPISPVQRITRAYSKFVHMYGENCSNVDSMYGYCKANYSSFKDFQFIRLRTINIFGL